MTHGLTEVNCVCVLVGASIISDPSLMFGFGLHLLVYLLVADVFPCPDSSSMQALQHTPIHTARGHSGVTGHAQ